MSDCLPTFPSKGTKICLCRRHVLTMCEHAEHVTVFLHFRNTRSTKNCVYFNFLPSVICKNMADAQICDEIRTWNRQYIDLQKSCNVFRGNRFVECTTIWRLYKTLFNYGLYGEINETAQPDMSTFGPVIACETYLQLLGEILFTVNNYKHDSAVILKDNIR